MKLQSLDLNVAGAVSKPYIRSAPGERWDRARERNLIPESLFRLYSIPSYFSIDRIPKRLMDEDKLLHSFISALVEAMESTFEEIDDLLTAIATVRGAASTQ